MFEEITCKNCKKKFKPIKHVYAGFTFTYCPECNCKTYLELFGTDLGDEIRYNPVIDLCYKSALTYCNKELI